MKPITKKLLLWLSAVAAWAVTLVYAFDPLNPEQHRLCSGLPQHASWNVSEGNKSVVWSYLGDLLNVVVPEWVQIWGALTPRTTEWKTLCTFTCDYWYKLNPSNQTCVEDPDVNPCPEGYYWNNTSKKCEKNSNSYPAAIVDGYNYAYELGIQTRAIDEANLYDTFTKQELAKIISIWARDELSHTIDKNASCNFPDITDADGDYVEYITKACQMWIMGEDGVAFNPYGTVTYATFLTTLSRALWWELYDWGNPYYVNHFAALKNLGVVNNPDPEAYVLRWYAYSMIYKAMYNAPGDNEVVLQNNLSESKAFKRNEVIRETVFNWTYSTVRSSKINWWMIIKRDATENSLWANNAVFYLYINWELVWELKSTNNVWFSSWFNTINLTAWETVDVRVDVKIDWHETNAWTFNYGLELFDLASVWELNNITDLVPMIVRDNSTKMDISSDVDGDVIPLDNGVILWKFLLRPSTSWSGYIDTFSIDFDSWVNTNIENLIVSIDWNWIDCEDKWTNTIWSHWIQCNNVDYEVPEGWAEVKVKLNNPWIWAYRTTIWWINQYWDFYSVRRFVVNPFIKLELDHDDGLETYYNILGEGLYGEGLDPDHISNIKLYSEDLTTIDEANNATPVIEVNDEIDLTNPDANIYFDNLAEAVIINTFRYDSNWKTYIINKSWYPDYFVKSLGNLKVHAKSNS